MACLLNPSAVFYTFLTQFLVLVQAVPKFHSRGVKGAVKMPKCHEREYSYIIKLKPAHSQMSCFIYLTDGGGFVLICFSRKKSQIRSVSN